MINKEQLVDWFRSNPVSVVCAGLSLVLLGAIYFRSDEIPLAEAELAGKVAEADRLALNGKYSSQLKAHLDAITGFNSIIGSRMIRVSELGNNSQYFQQLRRDTGVVLVDFRQLTTSSNLPKTLKTAFIPVAFSVSVTGGLSEILDFTRSLEAGTYYGRILSGTLSTGPGSRAGPLSLALSLEILGIP